MYKLLGVNCFKCSNVTDFYALSLQKLSKGKIPKSHDTQQKRSLKKKNTKECIIMDLLSFLKETNETVRNKTKKFSLVVSYVPKNLESSKLFKHLEFQIYFVG
eukprot:UN13796